MKRLLSLSGALLLLLGCGEPASVNLGQGPSFARDGNPGDFLDSMASSCNDEFTAELVQEKFTGHSAGVKLSSGISNPVDVEPLSDRATLEQRCSELRKHFSGAPIKEGAKVVPNSLSLDIFFDVPMEAENQMVSGRSANLRIERARLFFTDGSLKDSLVDLELRCSGTASVTCQVMEIGDHKKFGSYEVKYSDQCTFRSKLLLFSFSDHKSAQLDVQGELNISAKNGAQLKFNKMSWMGLD